MSAVFGFGIGFQFYKRGLALVAPVATAATSVTGTSFVANWNTYDGATTYYLDVSTSSTFATFVLQNQAVSAPTTNYTVTGLTACTTYYYRVRAEGVVPTISVAPTLSPSGTQLTGAVITCGTGTWSSQGAIFNYRWKRNGVAITGSTSSTYTIQAIDAGTTITCDVQNQNGFGKSAYVGTSNSVSAVAVDPDAQAFITAAGITNATQQQAINTLVVDMKGYGIWTKMKAIYPFVGGTASTHKWNLKDPRDLDAAYRLVFNGGWTHSSTGATPNGSNGYANTFFDGSILGNNYSISYYSRTNIDELGSEIGQLSSNLEILTRYLNFFIVDIPSPSDRYSISNNNSTGLFNVVNNSTIGSKAYKNNTEIYSGSHISNSISNSNFTISLGLGRYSSKELAFFGFGQDFTTTDAANYYTAVQSFQTTLSRNV